MISALSRLGKHYWYHEGKQSGSSSYSMKSLRYQVSDH